MFASAGGAYVATVDGAPSGLTGTIGYSLETPAGVVVLARTTAGIIELVPGAGSYAYTGVAPTTPGVYVITWSLSADVGAEVATDELDVTPGLAVLPSSGDPAYPTINYLADQAVARQRIVRNRAQPVTVTFGADGDGMPDVDTDVTVIIVDSAGDVVFAGNASPVADTGGGDAGVVPPGTFSALMPGYASLDRLTALWTATIGGEPEQLITTVEVCDRRLFTLAQAREFTELSPTKYSDAMVEAARMAAEDFLEHECRCAFTGRYGTETHSPPFPRGPVGSFDPTFPLDIALSPYARNTILVLRRPNVNVLRSITQDGVPFTDAEMATVSLDRSGYLQYPTGWCGELVISYEYGAGNGASWSEVGRACVILARHRLLKGPLDDRAIGLAVEGGGTVPLLTPGLRGSVTGIPEVDVFLARHAYVDNSVS